MNGKEVGRVLGDEVDTVRDIVGSCTDHDLIAPTGCQGWRVADLIVHLRMGAESVLVGLASPTDAPADRDFISFWRDWPARGSPSFSDVRFTWASASAYGTGDGLRKHFDDVAVAVATACASPRKGNLQCGDHVMPREDFLATWAVEFAVHHLDLVAYLPERDQPRIEALQLAEKTLDGLLGVPRPARWGLATYVAKATDRLPLTEAERAELGAAAFHYPTLG